MSAQIWIQTVLHSDGIPKKIFLKVDFEKKRKAEDKNHANLTLRMQKFLKTDMKFSLKNQSVLCYFIMTIY